MCRTVLIRATSCNLSLTTVLLPTTLVSASRSYDTQDIINVLKMLSQKHPELEADGQPAEPVVGGAKGGGGVGNNGAVTPGSYANGEGSKEFLSTGRTGRRNAMPDILGHHADTGTADLSTRLEALTTEPGHDQPGTSGLSQSEASTSQQQMG